jgi:hypothetical protein
MYKNATYREKFADLQEWAPIIIESVKKDLKNDHLKKDFYFTKKFLASKNFQKATTDELATAYQQAIAEEENGEEIGEFIASRWLLKNSELYHFFEQQLSKIDSNFTDLEELSSEHSQELIQASNAQFGAPQTYLFAVLNSVVFPEASFQALRKQAKETNQQQTEATKTQQEQQSVESMRAGFEREVNRLTDKYEKKLAGLQKKYLVDMETLKKQVSQLQRKLQDKK